MFESHKSYNGSWLFSRCRCKESKPRLAIPNRREMRVKEGNQKYSMESGPFKKYQQKV